MVKKSALGKGLGALIDDAGEEKTVTADSVNEIDINKIEVNPFQPRKNFDEEALNELATSIKEIGIIQPITVRKVNNNKFQLIAGERRYRAAQIAGLNKLPAFVRFA
ncbi:MAG: ParB/RepB/Spo0J family partition protein, partial [Bacteroidota bacterium]|nr:ParB/RepB/Spo0J family partition protein [Bacteroidota bacterium]